MYISLKEVKKCSTILVVHYDIILYYASVFFNLAQCNPVPVERQPTE